MRVTVLSFGILRDIVSDPSASLELPDGATVGDLLRRVQPSLRDPLWSAIAVAVNQEYVPASHALADGDEVALLPPVSGGAGHAQAPHLHIALTHHPIDAAALAAAIRHGDDGAVVVFDGVVRNNTRGRRTLYLFYEAYPEMALARMQLLADQALAAFPVRAVTIVHRLGRLEVGDTSVLIAVASAHRAPAFDACRWLIDTLKQSVPIWKKEFFEDGAVWAQGDPFPSELRPGQPSPAAAPPIPGERAD